MDEQPLYEPDEDTFLLWDALQAEIIQSVSGKPKKAARTLLSTQSLLDMGAGSGYLGLEAAKMGVGSVTFVDSNPVSVSYIQNVLESEDMMHRVICSDLFEHVHGEFEYVVFNTPYLPDEPDSLKDISLHGGTLGNEVALRFVKALAEHLASDGVAFLLSSSLARPEMIEREAKKRGFSCHIVAKKKLFFEELIVYKLVLRHKNM